MGNYSSTGLYGYIQLANINATWDQQDTASETIQEHSQLNIKALKIEVFKGIVSAAGSETHTLQDQAANNHDEVWDRLSETLQESDLLKLKFLHNLSETAGEPTEPKTEGSPSPDVPSASSNSSSPAVSSLVSTIRSSGSSSSGPEPRPVAPGPPTLQKLNVELQDMREELELLKTQHKKELKLLMNELDEEKKMRLSLQVEVERIKKHMSK